MTGGDLRAASCKLQAASQESLSPPPAGRGSERGRDVLAACSWQLAAGFTLIELLVSLGIFAISVGLIADLFLSASRQQARTVAGSRAQSDARLIIETVARELHEGSLDFSSGIAPTVLALRGSGGEFIRFERVENDASRPCPARVTACLAIGRGASADAIVWAPLTGTDVEVRAFDVLVVPTEDPFVWDAAEERYRSDEQPRVTLRLALDIAGSRPGASAALEAQTTVVSRAYQR